MKMSLLNLPVEILFIIFHQLDLVSLFNLYGTCGRLRHIIASFGDLKVCNLSMSTMATVNTLKLSFFKDISRNIQELNMCGISDLNKKTLMSTMSKLKCLKTLNISYTNMNILDFIEIYQACPSIKNITINFTFTENNQNKLTKEVLIQCQEVFRNMESVNFVGNVSNLLYSELPCFILNKAKLKTLQYTAMNCEMVDNENEECEEGLHFDEFCLYFFDGLNPILYYCFLLEMYLFSMLDFEDYEVIIIMKVDTSEITIYATPIFTSFFSKHFDLNAECLSDFGVTLAGNACVMLWSKTVTQFDEAFYTNLLQKLKPLFPFSFKSSANTPVPLSYDWYCTIPMQENSNGELGSSFVNELGFKRRRNVEPNYIINYDKQFQNKSRLQLSLHFNGEIKSDVMLSTNTDYLRKLTYLNLCGVVQYSSDFFNILFQCCNQLITLNIESPPLCSCFALISSSIPFSQTLKNIRLTDRGIDFELMFSSMSQCSTLENINICDMSSDTFNLSDPFIMFQKCNNLYCLYVYGSVTDTTRSKKLKIIESAQAKSQKSHLRFDVYNNGEFFHDPFVAVFKLNPIKPI